MHQLLYELVQNNSTQLHHFWRRYGTFCPGQGLKLSSGAIWFLKAQIHQSTFLESPKPFEMFLSLLDWQSSFYSMAWWHLVGTHGLSSMLLWSTSHNFSTIIHFMEFENTIESQNTIYGLKRVGHKFLLRQFTENL